MNRSVIMAARVSKVALQNSSYEFLVSACLAGINCTHKGKNNLRKSIKKLMDKGLALPVCPETMGSLPTPRENSEIVGGDGGDVLCKRARVVTRSGKNISKKMIAGAKKALGLAKKYKIQKAILKSKSPACGFGQIHDGTFRNVLKRGDGVLSALLRQNGIRIYMKE